MSAMSSSMTGPSQSRLQLYAAGTHPIDSTKPLGCCSIPATKRSRAPSLTRRSGRLPRRDWRPVAPQERQCTRFLHSESVNSAHLRSVFHILRLQFKTPWTQISSLIWRHNFRMLKIEEFIISVDLRLKKLSQTTRIGLRHLYDTYILF